MERSSSSSFVGDWLDESEEIARRSSEPREDAVQRASTEVILHDLGEDRPEIGGEREVATFIELLLLKARPFAPAGLERLIARCLAIDPADRPQTAAALVEALEDPETLSGSFASRATQVRRGSRFVRRAVVGALALVGAVAVSAGVYTRTHPNTASGMAESSAAAPAANLGFIAVLPFVSLGADSSNAYLATGVTNAVAGKLMKTHGLRVLAPGRPRSVKRRSDTVSTANVEARLVLEGTVERVGNRLRVTARLSSTADDVMQWANVYDRDVKDIFAVEDEIAEAIVVAVAPMAGQPRA